MRRWRFSSSGAPRLCNDALARVEQCHRISEFLFGDALHFVQQVTNGRTPLCDREATPRMSAVSRIGGYTRPTDGNCSAIFTPMVAMSTGMSAFSASCRKKALHAA